MTGPIGRRGKPRLIGPAVVDLVARLQHADEDDTVELRLTEATAAAIARIEARATGRLRHRGDEPPGGVPSGCVTVDRATATRWSEHAWQAVGGGLLSAGEAQALSDQLEPRGAA